MRLKYDKEIGDFVVGADGKRLRDFYIEKRRESGKTINGLEREINVSRQALRYVEMPNSSGTQSNSAHMILRALQGLGYTLELKEPSK